MECKMLSVIIPYYNGKKYISECLHSIYEQKCRFEIEVLIINDGSSESIDYLVDLCNDRYSDLNVQILTKENGGQGSARNYGLNYAKGKYVYFVDQDDMVPFNTFNYLVSEAEKRNVDLVLSGYQRIDTRGAVKNKVFLQQAEWSKYRCVAPWAKLYRLDFLRRNNIYFLPVVLGEDIYFIMQVNAAKPKVYIAECIGYSWRINEASVSNTRHRQIGEHTSIVNLLDKLETIEGIHELNIDRYLEYFYIKTAVWDILYTYNNDMSDVIRNNNEIWKWFAANYPHYLNNPYLSLFELKGESFIIKFIVSVFMLLKRWNKELFLIRILKGIVNK